MALHLWFTFALAYLATTLTPGPNVLLVVGNALRYGPAGIGVTFMGNLAAQLLVVSAVAAGVGALLLAMPAAFLALKLVGAGYLIYLGTRQLLARAGAAVPAQASAGNAPIVRWRIGAQAFVVSATNPKTLIFFCAFLPQFVEQGRPVPGQFAVMYLTIAGTVLLVHSVYCYSACRFSRQLRTDRWVVWFKRATGAVFVGLGMRLLSARVA
jgi:homoserine/homoserine lactone efflux protein